MRTNFLSWILIVSLGMFFTQCTESDPEGPEGVSFDCTDAPDACKLADDQRQFAFDIFRELHEAEPDENIFISPLSISTALSMAVNGAANQTRSDMQTAMNLGAWDLSKLNAANQSLLEVLPQLDPAVNLQIANSIWYREGFGVKPSFLDVNRDFYNSEVRELDFNDPASVNAINNWVNNQTQGIIKEMIREISPDAVMFLMNAIYFKGDWRYEFDPQYTQKRPFYLANGTQVQVDMMSMPGASFARLETPTFTAVDLPYGDSIYSMTIVLPKPDNSMDAAIDALSSIDWNAFSQSSSMTFSMPKFKMEYEQKLNKALTDLGMGIAFAAGQADFTNIADDKRLYISAVRHKAFVEVDEKGTEAAAVTSVDIEVTSINELTIDRPFIFIIRDHKTGSLLFIGKMMQP